MGLGKKLAEFLPGPVVSRTTDDDGQPRFELETPNRSIGRVRSFFGNVGILLRGYCYLRTLGREGVREAARHAVLNANYLKALLADLLPAPFGHHCMHEFIGSASNLKDARGITAMDIAKRLLDFGFHAPTIYFPLVVPEAMMIEPTETESKATLDAFAATLHEIAEEYLDFLRQAPHAAPVSRPDDVQAARQPILLWSPDDDTADE